MYSWYSHFITVASMTMVFVGCAFGLAAQTRIAVLNFRCGELEIGFSDFLVGPGAGTSSDCLNLQRAVAANLGTDPRVRLITKTEQAAVEAERELQRNEDFLEDSVVDQWLSQGVEYFLTGSVSPEQGRLVLNLHRGYDQHLMISKEATFTETDWSQSGTRRRLALTALQQILTELFPADVPLVKVIKGSKSNARTVLIAGGSTLHLRRHQELVVKTTVLREEGENIRAVSVPIASIVVDEVENENFSRCVVMSGGREIREALDAGQEVFVEGF